MEQAEPIERESLAEKLEKLVEVLGAPPKRKDVWDVLGVVTTFAGTVVIAGISLYVTQSFQSLEAERAHEFQEREAQRSNEFNRLQLETQRAQVRVEELKAITALAPLLASSDATTRETGRQLLQAVDATSEREHHDATSEGEHDNASSSNSGQKAAPAAARSGQSVSLIDQFAKIALSAESSVADRVDATRKIGEIATSPQATAALRERAADIATKIVSENATPPDVKAAASDVIRRIKQIPAEEAARSIAAEPEGRTITEVILHSSFTPSDKYRGAETLLGFANGQLVQNGWGSVSWHYAIAPDGSIWLGMPFNEPAIHTPGHQKNSISVMLIMDGSKELPSDAQRTSAAIVLQALFTRLKISATADSPPGTGFHFHKDYSPNKFCPGTLLTKETVLGWLSSPVAAERRPL